MTSARTRARLVSRLRRDGIRNREVLEAIDVVPRHLFVDEALEMRAYEDTALPITYGQTISQPWVVARMTEALLELIDDPASATVLEIGTGSGYQTAVLDCIFSKVYSVERIEALALAARDRLEAGGAQNVELRVGDGFDGWPDRAPFDAIIVTAAPEEIPLNLTEQLTSAGVMVIPVGAGDAQELLRLQRDGQSVRQSVLELVRFVPMRPGVDRGESVPEPKP